MSLIFTKDFMKDNKVSESANVEIVVVCPRSDEDKEKARLSNEVRYLSLEIVDHNIGGAALCLCEVKPEEYYKPKLSVANIFDFVIENNAFSNHFIFRDLSGTSYYVDSYHRSTGVIYIHCMKNLEYKI